MLRSLVGIIAKALSQGLSWRRSLALSEWVSVTITWLVAAGGISVLLTFNRFKCFLCWWG